MRKNLLIITTHQFGYHTDYLNWCKFLVDEYNIIYLTMKESNKVDVILDGVDVINIPYSKNIIKRLYKYIKEIQLLLKNNIFTNIIVTEQLFSIILRPFIPSKGLIFDIRSVAVFNNKTNRLIYDFSYKLCTIFYPYCTGITQSIADFYKVKNNKFSVLPLGSNIISETNKSFEKFHLLYIGSLRNGFEETIIGFAHFHKEHPESTYTIIGLNAYHNIDTESIIKKNIFQHDLQNHVHFLGRLHHDEAKHYFDTCNIGVSYIPMTTFFDNQPPTKNFEYLLSGMVCIATSTSANKKIITNSNGVLINDNSNSFAEGLKELWTRRTKYDSKSIVDSQMHNTWEFIVQNILKNILIKRA
ncbi:hypothetical protein MASR2M117_19550 [Paludibacter sp.]